MGLTNSAMPRTSSATPMRMIVVFVRLKNLSNQSMRTSSLSLTLGIPICGQPKTSGTQGRVFCHLLAGTKDTSLCPRAKMPLAFCGEDEGHEKSGAWAKTELAAPTRRTP